MITINLRNEEYHLPGPITVREALKELGLTPETHLALREGKLLDPDEILIENDTLKLVANISGGGKAPAAG